MNNNLIARILAIIVLLGAILAILGWILNISFLVSVIPTWVSIRPITALSFLFTSILILVLSRDNRGEISNLFIIFFSFTMLLLMSTFLISQFSGVDIGLSKLPIVSMGGVNNSNQAIPTMFIFVLFAISGFVFISMGKDFLGKIFGIIIAVAGGIIPVLGYIFNIPIMYYSFPGYISVACLTSIFFLLLGIGLYLVNLTEAKK